MRNLSPEFVEHLKKVFGHQEQEAFRLKLTNRATGLVIGLSDQMIEDFIEDCYIENVNGVEKVACSEEQVFLLDILDSTRFTRSLLKVANNEYWQFYKDRIPTPVRYYDTYPNYTAYVI